MYTHEGCIIVCIVIIRVLLVTAGLIYNPGSTNITMLQCVWPFISLVGEGRSGSYGRLLSF